MYATRCKLQPVTRCNIHAISTEIAGSYGDYFNFAVPVIGSAPPPPSADSGVLVLILQKLESLELKFDNLQIKKAEEGACLTQKLPLNVKLPPTACLVLPPL